MVRKQAKWLMLVCLAFSLAGCVSFVQKVKSVGPWGPRHTLVTLEAAIATTDRETALLVQTDVISPDDAEAVYKSTGAALELVNQAREHELSGNPIGVDDLLDLADTALQTANRYLALAREGGES